MCCCLLHHIAGDGWSLGPLCAGPGGVLPGALRQGMAAALRRCRCSTPTTRCGSRRRWATRARRERDGAAACRSGPRRCKDLPEQIELPADRPRPAVSSHRGGHVAFSIAADLHRGLAALARETGASLFMVLQAGLAALLSRLGAGTDIAIGSPIAGRTDAALDDLIGFFVNTLVLRTDTSGQSELPRADRPGAGQQPCGLWPPGAAVRAAGRGAQPGALAVAASAVPGDAGVRGAARRRRRAGAAGLAVSAAAGRDREREVRPVGRARSSGAPPTARRPASTACWNTPATCSTQRPSRRWAARLIRLLEAAVADAERRARQPADPGARPSATPSCGRWNDTARSQVSRRSATLPALFAAQAARTPDAIAVVFEDRTLSYAELDAHANRLAHHLREPRRRARMCWSGCAPSARSNWWWDCSAVLKAGGAYLPLDPEYPRERLADMVSDAGLRVVLTAGRGSAARCRCRTGVDRHPARAVTACGAASLSAAAIGERAAARRSACPIIWPT